MSLEGLHRQTTGVKSVEFFRGCDVSIRGKFNSAGVVDLFSSLRLHVSWD